MPFLFGVWVCQVASTIPSGPLVVLVTVAVSRFSHPPSSGTIERIHGELERHVYGKE